MLSTTNIVNRYRSIESTTFNDGYLGREAWSCFESFLKAYDFQEFARNFFPSPFIQ